MTAVLSSILKEHAKPIIVLGEERIVECSIPTFFRRTDLSDQPTIAIKNIDLTLGLKISTDTQYFPTVINPTPIGAKKFQVTEYGKGNFTDTTTIFITYKERMNSGRNVVKIGVILLGSVWIV